MELEQKRLKKKNLARNRLLDLLESETEEFNRQEFSRHMKELREDSLEIADRISQIEQDVKELKESKENTLAVRSFIENRKGILNDLYRELENLSPDDKKFLIEGLLDGKIEIRKRICKEEGRFEFYLPPWRFNHHIFERLIAEGKITSLNKDGSSHSAGTDGDESTLRFGARWRGQPSGEKHKNNDANNKKQVYLFHSLPPFLLLDICHGSMPDNRLTAATDYPLALTSSLCCEIVR